MSVFGGIMLFAAGLAVGGGAVVFNRWTAEAQTSQLRRENEHLKQSAWKDRLEYETDRAWRRGYHEGRTKPMTEAERFVEMMDHGNIDFRGPVRAGKHRRDEG